MYVPRQIYIHRHYSASQNWSLEATRMTFLSGICGRFENFYFN